uniref:Photosystem I P700 chlorophyll a apoprotein A1 n=1 Tax=Pinus densiflora var. zhangwuensis TaxID=2865922 RepID=A0A8K1N7G8_PINDE|nr:photosystem I P700 apoprotein A1 [Pinus densiflora var. zhangwuensis]
MDVRSPETEVKKVKVVVDRDTVKTSFEKWAKPGHFSRTLAKGPDTTTWIWNLHADAHDFDSHTNNLEDISRKIFSAHFGQLAIIFIWLSGMYYHGARFSNYEAWLADPTHIKPSAQIVWPIVGQEILNGDVGGGFRGIQITSGFFQIWRASGITSELQLYCTAIGALIFAALMLFAGWFHYHKAAPKLVWFQEVESMLNHHLAGLLGLGSLSWAGHQIHVSLPINQLLDAGVDPKEIPLPHEFIFNRDLLAELYPSFAKGVTPFLTLNWSEYSDFLTFRGGLNPVTGGLWLTDTAHHHLAIAVLFLIAGHMYKTNWRIGHNLKDLLEAHKGPFTGEGHKGLYEILTTSWHAQLAVNLAMLGSLTIVVAHHMYSMPPYPYLAQDFTTQAALYTHHQYIAGFIMTGAFAHGAIFLIRDYNPEQNKDNVLARMLEQKEAIISHLSWVSLLLGFHTLGLYVHNDVMLAFGTPEKQILIEPIFAQWIQSAHGKTLYGFDILLSSTSGPAFDAGKSIWLPGWLNAINDNNNSLFSTIGPGDFLVHHAIALGLHTTTLILVKGALDARGSRLMPDKKDFGYSFPCDGPGRGGTCDISAWDAFYLAVFWMLNTIGWVTFYWHWKHITLWQGNVAQFNESSTYLMGWSRDYLWLNSSQLINGYNPFGMNSLSVWAWMFLFGHLVWATGFMFLISWRGYWQELIETLAWAHERTPLANLVRWRDKPVALSIVQARLVGLAHFSVGYIFTYAAFLIASTSGKFG